MSGPCVKLAPAERDSTFTLCLAEIVPDVWKLTRKAQSQAFSGSAGGCREGLGEALSHGDAREVSRELAVA